METLILIVYLSVAAIMLFHHGSTYAMYMNPSAVSIGGYIPPGYRWRIWYALVVSAALWPIAMLVAKSMSGGSPGRYPSAVKFTALGMVLGGGWGM